MKVGYVRISTKEQNTARQDKLMEELGVEKVYTDKMSGKSKDRPELQKMMEFVREDDILIVESISCSCFNEVARQWYSRLPHPEQIASPENKPISSCFIGRRRCSLFFCTISQVSGSIIAG